MSATAEKRLCRIQGLSLTQSLNFPDERERTKPTIKASRPRSVSPPRRKAYEWEEFCRIDEVDEDHLDQDEESSEKKAWRWKLKEFLYRSISEGRGRAREKEMERERLVQAALTAQKTKKKMPNSNSNSKRVGGRTATISKNLSPAETEIASKLQLRRCAVSAHERYYSANRAQAEQLKKKTFLPYRQALLGFLGPFQGSNSGSQHAPLSAS